MKVKVNPFLRAPKLAIIAENELGKKASPSTIRNVLHKKNLTGRKARQKPFISKRNQKDLDSETLLEFWEYSTGISGLNVLPSSFPVIISDIGRSLSMIRYRRDPNAAKYGRKQGAHYSVVVT
ncbi:hypothetical protein TNIN_403411 [Trichonephila inaurata madagascariensis]|uniref:Transposase Tc1-like domain-containing protein n=1 Tax=Trichonephila inaurata madagascariensis TaxID=2747483 RepID=A0A8X7CS20_9ARAC|nr:hypothetical protein TNIN_403411 [Trichonephila inaurata madagascariensis]